MQDLLQTQARFSVADLIALVTPAQLGQGRYRVVSPAGGTPRVYGGQYVAQAIMAAGDHIGAARLLHSLSGQFLSAGRIDQPMDISVEMLREGRSFSICRVDFRQQDNLLFTATLSFQLPEPGAVHLGEAPPLPAPEGWMTEAEYLTSIGRPALASPYLNPNFFSNLLERRSRFWRDETVDAAAPAQSRYWYRLAEPLSAHQTRFDPAQEPLLHQALIGYFSDLGLLATGARPLGYGAWHPQTRSSSLMHVILFHAPQRVDEWYFSAMNGLGVGGSRASATARIYSEQGRAVMTVTQEGVVRRQTA